MTSDLGMEASTRCHSSGESAVFSRKLTDAEIEQLANWYAAQPGRVGQEKGEAEEEP